MRRVTTLLLSLIITGVAVPSLALNSGSDILVPAAGRVGTFITDLYVMNPGSTTVSVTVYWLERDQANTNPQSISFTLLPGESQVMEDIILNDFGFGSRGGGFRVVATGDVVVNSRIYSLVDGVTFGQGFEGIPASLATTSATDIVGLAKNSTFRSNFYACAGANGATLTASLRDANGSEIAAKSYTLGAYQPMLVNVTDFSSGLPNFDYGSIHVTVSSGSAVVGASKADNDPSTGDPTTLESWVAAGAGTSVDGTYQIAIYDSLDFASGGNLVVSGGEVTEINGTYTNFDKLDGSDPACTLIFLFGGVLSPGVEVSDFGDGVVLENSYPDSGTMSWTITFDVDNNTEITGTIDAEGSDFTGEDSGCNGTFPSLLLRGGKGD
jgi:hypothetical protein